MTNPHSSYPAHEENPLAGDVDNFVHPDETMYDAERDMADKYPLEAWSEDSSENYWAEYDALYPEHAEDESGDKGAVSRAYDSDDASGVFHGPYPKTEEHPYDQSSGVLNAIEDARLKGDISQEKAERLQNGNYKWIEDDYFNDLEDDIENDVSDQHEDYDDGSDWDAREDYADDHEDEDPLIGDVEPTGGYYEEPMNAFDAHRDWVHRQHGN